MGVDDKNILNYSEAAAAIAADWGWKLPSAEVMSLAEVAFRLKGLRSGEALVELGLMTPSRLEQLMARKPKNTRTLEWIAQSDPSLRPQIERVLALRTGHPFYESLESLPSHVAMQSTAVMAACDALDAALLEIEARDTVLVFSAYSELLKFASAGQEARMNDPIRKAVGDRTIRVAVGRRDQVISRLAAIRGKDNTDNASNIVAMWFGANAQDKLEKTIARILDHGLSHDVTDIAISPQRGNGSLVEMRRNGDMISCPVVEKLSVDDAAKIVDFLLAKSNANPNLSKVKDPRDGNIIYRSASGDAELRLSFIPLNQPGEYLISVSIRLIARKEKTVELSRLNIDQTVHRQISAASKLSKGFILVVGGTNTGKSTTIAGALEENFRHFGRSRKRLSLEKPVERLLRGVTQINVPAQDNDGFSEYLKALKRHDPDVIFIGEILDKGTADVAVTAAISGHLVLSTTHANDTLLGYDSLAQMLDLNKRYQFIESLSLIVAQDMVREVCECGHSHAPTPEERELFEQFCEFKSIDGEAAELPAITVHINPEGCPACKNTGISRILPINEVLPVTAAVKNAMFAMLGGEVVSSIGENRRDVIAKARTSTLFASAMALVRAGKIELGEAIR